MLNFLSQGNQKEVVGMALTPGIGLEAVVLDKTKTTILNYGRKKLDYNFSTREINDYVQLRKVVSELVDEMKIAPKTFVYLVLPNVYFDFLEIPAITSNEEIKTATLSKAEEFYIFKRDVPVSGWCEVLNPDGGTQKKIAYSSFQKSAVDEIKDILTELGLVVVGIESSYSASLRGLYLTGALSDVIIEQSSWTAMLINTNSYTLFQMDGKNLLDYSEVPLAIKSFSMEEAYQAIVSSASQLLSNFDSTRLFIISQTDDICAEVLKRQMQFDREIIAIDTNKYSKRPVMEVLSSSNYEEINSLTLNVIGAANSKSDFGLVLNILQDDPNANLGVYGTINVFGTNIEVTGPFVNQLLILATIITLAFFGSIIGICAYMDTSAQESISDLQSQIQNVDRQINEESKNEVKEEIDMSVIIDEVAEMNVKAMNFYDSISTDIPKNVWLTKYYNQQGDRIAVRGIAESIIDIYEYYKNLRIVSPQSDIKLTELKVVTDDMGSDSKYLNNLTIDKDIDRLYSFEISNTQIQQTEPMLQLPDAKTEASIIPSSVMPKNIEATSNQMIPVR